MRAVNLIPRDEQRGPGQSGRAVYALLGGLGLVLLLVVVYVFEANTVQDRRSTLASVDAELASAKAEAARLKPFGDFAALRRARVTAIRTIADGRFDWARALRGVSVAMPADVTLTTLDASMTAEGTTSPTSTPTMKLEGCTAGQRSVSRMLAALRQVAGVEDIDLGSSGRPPTTGNTAQSENPRCATTFLVTVTFTAPKGAATAAPGAAPAAKAPGAAPGTPATTTTPAPSTAPAAPAAPPAAATTQGASR